MKRLISKRTKWLFKNLTFPQLIKYVIKKKPEFIYCSSFEEGEKKQYMIRKDLEITEEGTILIKPSGMNRVDNILKELSENDIGIKKSIKIPMSLS